MVKILLSCNSETYHIANDLRADIQQQLGFKVTLDVEDGSSSSHSDEDGDHESYFQEEEVTAATVLLIFDFGEESISAWVTIEDTDKISRTRRVSFQEESEIKIINFSSSFEKGIRMLRSILAQDFDLMERLSREKSIRKTALALGKNKPRLLRNITKLFSEAGHRNKFFSQ
ncbi:MAG: hypothetical protein SGBAC_008497 [Bacillariaceae sp.]